MYVNRIVLERIADLESGLKASHLSITRKPHAVAGRKGLRNGDGRLPGLDPHPIMGDNVYRHILAAMVDSRLAHATVHTNLRAGLHEECPECRTFIKNLSFSLTIGKPDHWTLSSRLRTPTSGFCWSKAIVTPSRAWLGRLTTSMRTPGPVAKLAVRQDTRSGPPNGPDRFYVGEHAWMVLAEYYAACGRVRSGMGKNSFNLTLTDNFNPSSTPLPIPEILCSTAYLRLLWLLVLIVLSSP